MQQARDVKSLDARRLLHFYRPAILRAYVTRVENGFLFWNGGRHRTALNPQGVALVLTDHQYNTGKVSA